MTKEVFSTSYDNPLSKQDIRRKILMRVLITGCDERDIVLTMMGDIETSWKNKISKLKTKAKQKEKDFIIKVLKERLEEIDTGV